MAAHVEDGVAHRQVVGQVEAPGDRELLALRGSAARAAPGRRSTRA
ncbi:hypothetical protein [Curtobacterium sp. GD1]|nr:hypothetical protein [Curtobacterium sp. GD1]MCC8909136.1 hypothetical protein [Curtobacterium sp. GD1]